MNNCKPIPWWHKLYLFCKGKNLFSFKPGTHVEFRFDGKWIGATCDKPPCSLCGIIQVALRDVDLEFSDMTLTGTKTTVPVNRLRKAKAKNDR